MNCLQPTDTVQTKTSHNYLRLLYAPYTYFIYLPFLILWTFIMAQLIIGMTFISSRGAHILSVVWAKMICWVNFTSIRIEGSQYIDSNGSYIIMSNHQSLFDIPALFSSLRCELRWVMKQELRKIPVFGLACEKIGHIYIDRKDRQKAIANMQASKDKIRPGVSVIIFPEGTRSETGHIQDFKKGGFMLALQAGLPILPITIVGSNNVLPSRSFSLFPGKISIRVHEPINTQSYSQETREQLIQKVRNQIISGIIDD